MTLSRQRRHKARAAALAEPFRQKAIDEALDYFERTGEECLISTAGILPGGHGVIHARAAGYVEVGPPGGKAWTSIPRSKIERVQAYPRDPGVRAPAYG